MYNAGLMLTTILSGAFLFVLCTVIIRIHISENTSSTNQYL